MQGIRPDCAFETLQVDARDLPFPADHFDAILSIDAYQYFGTDCLFLPYILRFLKTAGTIAFASAGLTNNFESDVPEHLTRFWQPDAWCLQTSRWWREHWQRTNLVDVMAADTLRNGWEYWLAWAKLNRTADWYVETLTSDAGRFLGYVRMIARRIPNRPLLPYDLRTGK